MSATYLSRNKGTEAPSSLFFLHTEHISLPDPTNAERRFLSLRCFSASRVRLEKSKIRNRESISGTRSGELWDFLWANSSKERCSWVFAHKLIHHLTKLDFWKLLEGGALTLEPLFSKRKDKNGQAAVSWAGKMCLEDRPAFVVCRSGESTYKMVDTSNYWPSGIEGIAEDDGIALLPYPGPDAPAEKWQEHANNKVQVIETAVVNLIRTWRAEQCGTFQMTGPMLSMVNFRHTCGIRTGEQDKVDIVCMPNHKSHDLERKASFGAIPQCFFVGERKEKIYHIDCNSLYPFVMRENHFPRRFVRYQNEASVGELESITRCYGTVASVFLDTDQENFPCRVDGKQFNLVGKFWATLSGPELTRALNSKAVKRVGTVQTYSIAPLFKLWVDYWYNRKLESSPSAGGKRGEYEFSKLILNSLSGKWFQRGRQWRERPGVHPLVNWDAWPEFDHTSGKWTKCRGVAGNTQVLTDTEEPRHSFPLIFAYITAYAREYMRQVIAVAGPLNALYMATDSLILTSAGFENLTSAGYIHPNELGKFKLQGEYNSCAIRGSNWYELDGQVTASGLLGASLAGGGNGQWVELAEQVGTLIRRQATSEIAVERVRVPIVVPDRRGTIDATGRWIPFHVIDSGYPAQCLAGPAFRQEYSLDSLAGRRLLVSDV